MKDVGELIRQLTDTQRSNFMLLLLPWSGQTTGDAVKVADDVALSVAQCAALCKSNFSEKDTAFREVWNEMRAWQLEELEQMLQERGGA